MSALHPQLAAIRQELDAASSHARRLTEASDDAEFGRRPREGSWSVAECLAHLNLTTEAFLPLIDAGLRGAPGGTVSHARRFRRDPLGWLFCWSTEPPFRVKVKTPAPFVPSSAGGRHEVLATFDSLQTELARRLEAASGRDLGRIRIVSAFDPRFKYNLYSCFKLLPAHQRRHLWQADNALAQVRGTASARARG